MLIFHEAPLAIFNQVQALTDGDFALVHLIISNTDYRKRFVDAIAKGRTVFLDNSLYELRETFASDLFVSEIKKLRPTAYIVPDSWKDCDKTIALFNDFIQRYPDVPGKRIGVAQGLTTAEVAKCYSAIEPNCDIVAFNFDGSHYWYDSGFSAPSKAMAMSCGRHRIISELLHLDVINVDKAHHLLGIGVPQEIQWYDCEQYRMITSIDTSNPVTHGLNNIRYSEAGLLDKVSDVIAEDIYRTVNDEQYIDILHNINKFRSFAQGDM